MPSNDDIRTMFFEECDDLMEALFEGLSLLENDEAEDDTINAIFRMSCVLSVFKSIQL